MENLLAGLLSALPEPVIAALDGRVQIWNTPAEAFFPGICRGMALEELLPAELADASADCGTFEGGVIRFTEWNGYRLCSVLRDGVAPGVLTTAGSEMRDILSLMTLARDRSDSDDLTEDKREKYAALLNKGLYRLLRVANHLSLMGEKTPAVQKSVFDFADMLIKLSMSVETRTGCHVAVDAAEELLFLGDRELLERLCLNLLSNARKYAPESDISIKLHRLRGRVILTVSDNGPGITPERMTQALQGSCQNAEAVQPLPGTGLGLAVVRRIAQLHEGTVVMESSPGRGTRVTVSLPDKERPTILSTSMEPYASRTMDPVLEELADVLDWDAYKHLFAD